MKKQKTKNNRFKIIICTLLIVSMSVVIFSNISMTSCNVGSNAKAMVVIEGNTNTVLYHNNKDTKLAMASTTKIMTAIVAIENIENLDQVVTVSDKAVGIEGTSIYLKKGEQIKIMDLLYGLMLASGNDCSVALAEIVGYDEFITKMNDLALKLGCENTHFVNPHGLDQDNHYTSAYDLAIITSYGMKNETFRQIVGTKKHTIEKTNVYEYDRYLKHKNALMFKDDNCIGVKTGFTDNAGRCLVSAYDKDGMLIISVVLNCQPMFDDCNYLTNLALKEYEMIEFVSPYTRVDSVEILNGEVDKIDIVTLQGYKIPVLKGEQDLYRVQMDIPKTITAPIEINQVVGSVKVYKQNQVIFESQLVAIIDSENIDIKYLIDQIIKNWK